MEATVNVTCYKSKVLKNGESPLMVRICKNGKKKYKSLGISVNPAHWDFKKNLPKPKCPNYEALLILINEKINEFQRIILDKKVNNAEFTATTLLQSTDTFQSKPPVSIIRKSKFPQNPKRSVRFSGKRTKRSVQKRKARNTQKAETKVL